MNKIINFHLVNNINWFENMICFLKSKYNLIPIDVLNDFYSGNVLIKNSCHITVDDGDKTFYEIMFPILKKHNVPASLFVSPKICEEELNFWFQEIVDFNKIEFKQFISDSLGFPVKILEKFNITSILKTMPIDQIHQIIESFKKRANIQSQPFQNMTVKELIEVDRSGIVSVGAHTLNHPILANESDLNCKDEIIGSINRLEKLLDHKVDYFAYPNGIPNVDFKEREKEILNKAKIKLAFTTEAKNFDYRNNKMSIPRIGVSNLENKVFLRSKLILGSPLATLKKLKPSGEFKERKTLAKLLDL